MKSNHERSNECLPPKKREIPPSTLPSESRSPMPPPPAAEPRAPENTPWADSARNGSVHRSGAQYKSLSAAPASDSVRLVSSLPALYTSPISQSQLGGTVHYAHLPPNLQFIASPYSAPYAGYMGPHLLPPPPPPPPLSPSQRSSSSSHPERSPSPACKYDQRLSARYAAAMPPPPTSLHHHHAAGAHYADRGTSGKEDAVSSCGELHNGGPERSRRFGPLTPDKAVRLRDPYEARRPLPPPDYAHDPVRTSVVLPPEERRAPPSRGSPGGKTRQEKGALLGKAANRTPSSSGRTFTFPPPLSADNLKGAISPLSPQTVIQTTHNSMVESLPTGIYPQSPVIGYIAGAGGNQHAPITYHAGLQQHVLITGTQPVIIPVGAPEPPASPAEAHRGDAPDDGGGGGGSYRQARAQLHLPALPPPQSLPAYFVKGSIIQLADGELKRVEELKTEDFIQSAEISSELKIDSSTVERIDGSQASPDFAVVQFSVGEHRSQVSVEVLVEYPFFVFGQGWSSCCPDRTSRLLELPCAKLSVGDVCISLTLKNLRNGSVSKTHPSEEVPGSSTPDGGRFLRAPETVGGGGGGVGGRWQNGVENGDLATGERGSFLRAEPGKTSAARKRRWSAPEGRQVEKAEEPPLTLLKPSFVPHDVKVTIEGRSNVGK
ncbi:ataxin-1a [Stigmatopora argus]